MLAWTVYSLIALLSIACLSQVPHLARLASLAMHGLVVALEFRNGFIFSSFFERLHIQLSQGRPMWLYWEHFQKNSASMQIQSQYVHTILSVRN